jgi:hypothetical protein
MDGTAMSQKHPRSISATNLSKLGHCEMLVVLGEIAAQSTASRARTQAGNKEHDRFHIRASVNAAPLPGGGLEQITSTRRGIVASN